MPFKVGRRKGRALLPAFDIEQAAGGGIRLTNVSDLSDGERQLVYAHYGRPIRSKVVFKGEQHFRTFQPGAAHHFEHASYVLPSPFCLMP